MGSQSSKATAVSPGAQELNQQIIERLRALDLQNRERKADALSGAEKGYVFVDRLSGDRQDPPPAYASSSSGKDVSIAAAEQWEKELLQDPKNRLALSAFTANAAPSILSSRAARIADTHTFNVSIPHEGAPVTNQRASGRCWLFAATNVFRIALMKKHNLEKFELSQAYLFFWDKLEKANYFLEQALDTVEEDLDGRLMQALLNSPVGDGGQWDMVANLVQKYGIVPQDVYPDSLNAMNSSAMDTLITTKLREDALRLRSLAKTSRTTSSSSLSAAKHAMLREIHLILTLMLGPPPSPNTKFSWEYYSSDKKYHKMTSTPLDFSSELSSPSSVRACNGTDVHRLFSLTNDPRNDPYTLLTVNRLGNVSSGRPVTYVNVPISVFKTACVAMLKRGMPVFFGSDVGKYSDSSLGIMDTALYDYELGFNVRLGMSKAERLRTGESMMTHAMVLTAVQLEDGKSVRWRVENSWSDTPGDKGYFVMTDAWMDEFVYQAVVDPAVVDEKVRKVLKTQAKVLPLWDPMGALA